MSISSLSRALTEIAAVDPSAHGHTGPDTPEVIAAYARRNTLVWQALAEAVDAGLPAGVDRDPGDPHPVVVYIDLPGCGQVSWHLPDDGRDHDQPAYADPWDGHSTHEKYLRIDLFTGAHGAFSCCPNEHCYRCGEVMAVMESRWRANIAKQGITLIDVRTLPPEKQAEHAQEEYLAMLASEHAAAADPDPDYGRDLDGDW